MLTFRELKVWQKMHQLTLDVYQVTKDFPAEERYGVINQVRRASVSVAANIVEDFKRKTMKDQVHFMNLAESSLEETKYLLLLSSDLGYLDLERYKQLLGQSEEVGRMLSGFRQSLSRSKRVLLTS